MKQFLCQKMLQNYIKIFKWSQKTVRKILLQILPQCLAAGGMTELSNGFCFYLPDPFPCYAENLSNFFKRPGIPRTYPVSKTYYVGLPGCQSPQNIFYLQLQTVMLGLLNRIRPALVLHKILEPRILLLAYRG